jgi:hypothetical protein
MPLYEPPIDEVEITGPEGPFTIYANVDIPAYFENDGGVPSSYWLDGGSYGLATAADTGWPALDVSGAAVLPRKFSVTSPSLTSSSTRQSSTIPITWSGGARADYVHIYMEVYTSTTTYDSVECIAADDGSFTVPASAWDNWSVGRSLLIIVTRVTEDSATIAHNNSVTAVAGQMSVLGVLTTQ